MTTSSGVTRSKVCSKCGKSLLIDAFRKFGRGYRTECRECEGGGEAVKEPCEATPVDESLRSGPALSIAPGLGVEAWIENECLQLNQGEDVVALSKTEAKVLFAQFGTWAGLLSEA